MRRSLQIIPMGWEWDRFIYGLKEYPPKKAILICSPSEAKWSDRTIELANKLIEKISPLVETELVYVDFYDFEKCIFTLIDILEASVDKYTEININLSSGTKPLITACVLASQYYPINLFYVVPEQYNVAPTTFISSGAKKIIELPTFDLKEMVIPTKRQKSIFAELSYEKTSMSQLVERYAKTHGIELTDEKTRNLKALFSYHLQELVKKKLVKLEMINRQSYISLTNTGKFIYKIIEKQMETDEKAK